MPYGIVMSQARQSGLVQQQRCFAEAAVAPKFDWDSLENTIASDDGKRDLASLRSTFIDVQQKFDSMSQVCKATMVYSTVVSRLSRC